MTFIVCFFVFNLELAKTQKVERKKERRVLWKGRDVAVVRPYIMCMRIKILNLKGESFYSQDIKYSFVVGVLHSNEVKVM